MTLLGVVTMVEVWLLLSLGKWMGALGTMAWMVGSFFLGIFLLRWGGLKVLLKIHRQILDEVIPTDELLEMILLAFASLLLILPGFFTDILGLIIILPPFRWGARGFIRRALRRMMGDISSGVHNGHQHDVIEISAKSDPGGERVKGED